MSQTPLLDQLRAHPPRAPWFVDPHKLPAWRTHRDRMLAILRHPDLRTANIDAIAERHYRQTAQEFFDLRDLPPLPPGPPILWLEHALPTQLRSEIGDQDLRGEPTLHGHAGFLLFQALPANVTAVGMPDRTANVVVAELFLAFGQPQEFYGPHGNWAMAFDAAGKILDRPCLQGFQRPEHNERVKDMQAFLYPALLAISDLAVAGLRQPAFL